MSLPNRGVRIIIRVQEREEPVNYILHNDRVIHPTTGEVVADVVRFQKSPQRVIRQGRTTAQRRAKARDLKVACALGSCLFLSLLVAFVASNYRV